ncbi:MAG: Ig domain-containing protein, partial [Oscillospiraceae bacterium]|nr:Ig domain-containing protein [Oscillospiraceae bacterium]
MNKKTRSISLLTAVIMLFSAFSGITTGAYASGSGISGIIPAIQTKTGIDYTAGDVIVTGKIDGTENNNYFINLTKETFAVPAGYNIAAYSINGGTSWTAVAARAVFDAAALSKLFTRTRDVTLAFTDIYDSKARKPAANAAVVNFPEIKRRPALPTYNINYRIGADSTGITPGTWVLTERNGASSVKEGIEVAAADSAGRAPGELGYGRFYGLNGSANGIDISPLPENNRAVSSVYYIRIGALDNNDGTYTAASDSRRITVSGQPRHSSYSVNRNRKTISYGSNTYILKDDGSETPPELMEKSGTLDVSDYNGDIYLWGAESGSAPSSAIQKYSVDSTKASLDFTGETVNDLTGTLFEASVILMDDEPILGSSVGTSGITVNIMNKQYEMFAGDNFEFTALVGNSPDDLGADLMWESSNPATLSVTPPFLTTTGITHTKEVTGVSPGTVVVRAAALNDINSYDEVTITVRARPLNAIEINTASTLPAGEVGVAYSQPLSATSSFPVIWSFVSGEYPPGISLDSGVLRGTPTDPGTYFFTVEASNPAGTINPQTPAARMFSITVNPVTPRRSVTFLAYTGGDVSARLIAVGMPEIFSPHEVPVGATVRFAAVPASGYKILNWTDSSIPGQDKTVMTTGNNPVVLTASTYTIIVNPFDDGGGGTDPGILIMVDFEEIPPEEMIKVNFGVVSDSNTLGGTLSARGIVTGNTADTAMRAVDIPKSAPLITFSANPASEVNNRYEVEEWTLNGAVQSHKNNVFNHDAPQDGDTVTVKFTTITPIINAAALNAQLGAAYSETLTASGNGPFTWEIIAGSLPDGLTMSPAGVISGTPIVSGTYQFTVEAEDNFNKKAARGLSIVVGDIYTIEFFADPQAGGSVLASIGNRPLNDPVNYGLQGNNVVFTATPISSNYIFKGWTVEQQTGGGAWVKGFTTDGGLYIPPNPMNSTSAPLITYTLADLRSNIRVTAEFASTSQRRVNQGVDGGNGGISVRELPSGAFSSSPDNNFNTGTTIEFRAEPNTGYDVLKWEIDGVQVPDNTSRSYTYVVEAGNNPVVVRVFFDTLLNAPMAILNDPVLGLGLARAQFSYQMLATQWPFIIHAWEIESGELPDGLA